ncbi:DUF6524 family protein [Rhodovulum adriaticum]|uniref:Uncharacterized protein n=1 Tax=Rhodovulum adriaticum TaxID=35804 RepID=A0A4R2NXN7_RHOAD|nr:DUF6524 family protein [Rhodovulum adriaticum]MBK1635216.1 hypothetical protein [Rhodovulum adriaticum]TCP26351.1 hypothetical protein EV656_102316 [Rhodovulum adriaticum]
MSGFIFRWLIAFIILAATYNTTDYNFVTWAQENYDAQKPLVIGLGVLVAIVYLLLLGVLFGTLGKLGVLLLIIIFALAGYILVDNGLLIMEMSDFNIYAGLVLVSFVLGAAMSWRKSAKASRKAAQEETRAKAAKAGKTANA